MKKKAFFFKINLHYFKIFLDALKFSSSGKNMFMKYL